jgi:hypothetical protein
MADENQESQGLSLRDALMSAVDQHREPEEEQASAAVSSENVAQTAASAVADEAARARDQKGRFAAAADEKNNAAARANIAAPAVSNQSTNSAAGPAVAPVTASPVAPPSSWRKDRHESFQKLDRETQEYILERERQFATGVSTYKAEADRARSLQSAIEPFMPTLQRHNVAPEQWIGNLGRAHQILVEGHPQQKMQIFAQLAQDYGIDLSHMFGGAGQQQGAVDPNAQWLQQQLGQMQNRLQSFEQQQYQARQQAELEQQRTIEGMIEEFRADTANYPHFETVRETMAGILQSGLAQDLKSAYDKAIRMHDDLWQSQQDAQRQNAEAEQKRLQAEAAQKARAKVVSVRSATPSGSTATNEAQGRRAQLQEALSKHSAGRV